MGGGGLSGVVYPLPSGHYLPDLTTAGHHGHYMAAADVAGGGGHYGTVGGEPFGGGGSPATWQDLIQPRLPHIIKGKIFFKNSDDLLTNIKSIAT